MSALFAGALAWSFLGQGSEGSGAAAPGPSAAPAPASAPAPAAAPASRTATEAPGVGAFRRGRAAQLAGRWEEAKVAYDQAWAELQSFDTAANLGQVELELGDHAAAAAHLAFARERLVPSVPAATRAQLDAAWKRVVVLVARVKVDPCPVGARVSWRGEPLLVVAGRIFIDASDRGLLSVEAPGYALLHVEGGPWAAGEETTVAGPEALPPASAAGRPLWPAIVGATLVVAGATTGVVSGEVARRREASASDLLTSMGGPSVCGGSLEHPRCAEVRTLDDEAAQARTWSYVGYGTALAAAIGTAAYLLWPSAESSSGQAHLWLAPTWGGGALGGAF